MKREVVPAGGGLSVVHEDTEVETDFEPEPDLEMLHQQVMAIGCPDYFCSESHGTWSVTVTIVSGKRPGIKAEVRSKHRHKTLSEALKDVLEQCR